METDTFEHRVMVHPDDAGLLTWVAAEGEYTVNDPIAKLKMGKEEKTITMLQRWPVRRARPFVSRRGANVPLITGQRILDTFFPVAKGGAAGIPGPFGSGKTVTQHSIAKWADADIIVYIGCGERGNEMTEVLQEFPHLIDPNTPFGTHRADSEHVNMPVAAREASIYQASPSRSIIAIGLPRCVDGRFNFSLAEAREVSPSRRCCPLRVSAYPCRLAGFYERALCE
jgi:V/A-type H+-transporting ATPase subunit A